MSTAETYDKLCEYLHGAPVKVECEMCAGCGEVEVCVECGLEVFICDRHADMPLTTKPCPCCEGTGAVDP